MGVGDGAMGRGIVKNQGVYKEKLRDPRAEAKLGQFKSSLGRLQERLVKMLFVWINESWGCWWPRMLPYEKVFPETK